MASFGRCFLSSRRSVGCWLFGTAFERPHHFSTASADFLEVLRLSEAARLETAKETSVKQRQAMVQEKNHHYNRGLRGLDGPNIHGVHLPYDAHVRYKRGARGTWGLSRRSAGRLKYGLKKLADA
eukprot:gb/GFBE01064293.1/.p1 GENE.gb/GFBE01064293.1/~~gb/GFBE01064293.1/.p1  ORF type:complete len:125 (+),score=17.39 gb/GFBE01064293.1/:1-375(+)